MEVVVANWKMNKTRDEAVSFVRDIKNAQLKDKRKVIIAAPFTLLYTVREELKDTEIFLSAQNMYYEDKGAFTGEISPIQILDAGAQYVIIGHSERRHIFSESDELISKKLKSAVNHKLIPIFCIGEKLKDREEGNTFNVIERQMREGLSLLNEEDIRNVIFAYEPVWAIGTGVNATPEQAEEVHCYIRNLLEKNYLKSDAKNVKILYGGSVTPENASLLMSKEHIDGLLVGGASLKADSFIRIINF